MKHSFALLTIACAALLLMETAVHADGGRLSADRFDAVDKRGYFPASFKAAVHDLVDARQAVAQANAARAKLDKELPDLQAQATEAEAKQVALRQELATYEHPDESDFLTLVARMKAPDAKPDEQIALAQAYVWTYPASPHEADAEQFLQQVEKKLADQRATEKQTEADRAAAHAKLVERAQAHDLSVNEWRDFLRGMSQEDLVKSIGRPDSRQDDYWIYSGSWILDPTTKQKTGMRIDFDAGRVLNVIEAQP